MAWVVGCIVLAVGVLGTGAACAYLLAERRGLRGEAARLGEALQRCEEVRQTLAGENGELVRRVERAEAERQAIERQSAEAQQTFDALASKALRQANEQFLQLAEQKLAGQQKEATAELEGRKRAIDQMLTPIREQLEKHAAAVGQIEKQREGAYQGLKQQIASMQDAQSRLQSETQNLVTALRRADVRGRWGEVQLRRVVELAGMIPHCDFEEQVVVKGSDGVQKPDMVIRLPAGRTIAVDSKTPMVAFLDALQCSDDEERKECFKRHAGHIREKVRDLAAKRYQDQFERCPDFVVLFIPGESFLQPAVQLEPDLIERAMNLGVVIATPTTLISLLKAVAMGWREEQVAENAQRISDLGVELHRRIATAIEHLSRLGRSLDSTLDHYNKLVGSVESSVLPQARRFKDLGADSPKELPADGELAIEARPREVKAVEAVMSAD